MQQGFGHFKLDKKKDKDKDESENLKSAPGSTGEDMDVSPPKKKKVELLPEVISDLDASDLDETQELSEEGNELDFMEMPETPVATAKLFERQFSPEVWFKPDGDELKHAYTQMAALLNKKNTVFNNNVEAFKNHIRSLKKQMTDIKKAVTKLEMKMEKMGEKINKKSLIEMDPDVKRKNELSIALQEERLKEKRDRNMKEEKRTRSSIGSVPVNMMQFPMQNGYQYPMFPPNYGQSSQPIDLEQPNQSINFSMSRFNQLSGPSQSPLCKDRFY